jgi:hypothetical protein
MFFLVGLDVQQFLRLFVPKANAADRIFDVKNYLRVHSYSCDVQL